MTAKELKRVDWCYIYMSSDLQMKRKGPSQLNGTASPAGELEKEEDHHAGPELQRTGKYAEYIVFA